MKNIMRITYIMLALLAGAAQAQEQRVSDGLHIGPNTVHVVARHCQAYRIRHNWIARNFLRRKGNGTIDSAACAADPTTLFYEETTHNIKTNSGVDFIAAQIGGAASTSTAQWVGLSTSVTTPQATDTSLPSEITANGLGRAQGTFAHTAGTTTYTITELFTATGAQSGIAKVGTLTATYPGGTLVYEILLATPVSLNSGDQLSAQWTVTLSLLKFHRVYVPA